MPEPLKNLINTNVVATLAKRIKHEYSGFDAKGFQRDATQGLDALTMSQRSRHIAGALADYLPENRKEALMVICNSAMSPEADPATGSSTFLYWPLTMFVEHYGLEHFEESMRANYVLTQRFTAEFSIRPFLIHHEKRTLALLREWTSDANHHVRRLVSEGTRPRLPWASRLPSFVKNPTPVIELLDLLKDDPSLYVRRSVANNLNDIGKDNPDVLFATCATWLKGASAGREWVVKHALRSSIKRAEPGAFAVLGYDKPPTVEVKNAVCEPASPTIGGKVLITCTLRNTSGHTEDLLIDLIVHFVKSNGATSGKVFKLTTAQLQSGQSIELRKTISLQQHTTRTHYPGVHRVEVVVNGKVYPCCEFALGPIHTS